MWTLWIEDASDERAHAIALGAPVGHGVLIVRDVNQARACLVERTDVPQTIICARPQDELGTLVSFLRAHAALFHVPVVAAVPLPDEVSFGEAYAAGADDVILCQDIAAAAQRMRQFEQRKEQRPVPEAGRVIVAHTDDVRRRIVGRTLRLGGYDPVFAGNARELLSIIERGDARALVVTERLIESHDAIISQLFDSSGQPRIPLVVLAKHGDRDEIHHDVGVRFVNERAPTDHVLFAVTELMQPELRVRRGSERISFGTICSIRFPGELLPRFGYTSNLSRDGLLVRTLATPQNGAEVWVELVTPGHGPVHLRGKVVWTHAFGDVRRASPPGFGIALDPSQCPPADLAAYQAFHESLRKPRRQSAPSPRAQRLSEPLVALYSRSASTPAPASASEGSRHAAAPALAAGARS